MSAISLFVCFNRWHVLLGFTAYRVFSPFLRVESRYFEPLVSGNPQSSNQFSFPIVLFCNFTPDFSKQWFSLEVRKSDSTVYSSNILFDAITNIAIFAEIFINSKVNKRHVETNSSFFVAFPMK